MKKFLLSILFLFFTVGAFTNPTPYFVERNHEFTPSLQEYYSRILDAYNDKKWDELLYYSEIVSKNYSQNKIVSESLFYLGVASFYHKNYVKANHILSDYLQKQLTPKFFEQAINYKFMIAEEFSNNTRKHMFNSRFLPRWVSAKEDAKNLYDEVISSLPHHPLAAKSYFSKGKILLAEKEYTDSIEVFRSLIRRFPKNELAIDSYLEIGKCYLSQISPKQQNIDIIDLAKLNIEQFKKSFPQANDKLKQAEQMLFKMNDVYATSLFNIGAFYERTKKDYAAKVYFAKILKSYPNTKVAKKAHEKLSKINRKKT